MYQNLILSCISFIMVTSLASYVNSDCKGRLQLSDSDSTVNHLHCTKINLTELYNNVLKMEGNRTIIRVDKSKIRELKRINFAESLKNIDCFCDILFKKECDIVDSPKNNSKLYENILSFENKLGKIQNTSKSNSENTTESTVDNSSEDLVEYPEMLPVDYEMPNIIPENVTEALQEPQELKFRSKEVEELKTCRTCKDLCVNHWKNVTELHINNVGLVTLHKDFFDGFYDLVLLDLAYNKISKIEEKIFEKLYSLEVLNMTSNFIKVIKDDHFHGLLNIKYVDFSHNEISSMPKEFVGHREYILHGIDLSHNKIKKLDTRFPYTVTFIRLNYNEIQGSLNFSLIPGFLKYLDLSYNKIEKLIIYDDIQYVNLSHNRIKEFSSVGPMQNLDLSFNNISEICGNSLAHTGLKYLNLSHNNISMLRKNCLDLNFIEKISLSHNNISILEAGCFSSIYALKDIDFSFNSIQFETDNQTDPSEIFEHLNSLKILDVSENNFTVNWNIFSKLEVLETLNLSGNDVPYSDPDFLVEKLKHIKRVVVDSTLWQCEKLDDFVLKFRKHRVRVIEGNARDSCIGENS